MSSVNGINLTISTESGCVKDYVCRVLHVGFSLRIVMDHYGIKLRPFKRFLTMCRRYVKPFSCVKD